MLKTREVNVYSLNTDEIIKRELPNLNRFYNSGDELHSDVHWLLGEFIDNRHQLPIIEIPEAAGDRLVEDATRHYKMMMDALGRFFKQDNDTITKYMKSSITSHKNFSTLIEYARASWASNDKAIYGRYDLAIDENGKMLGAYELNGDTPVMLFESVNLQRLVSGEIYEGHAQLNNWWHDTTNAFASWKGRTVGVVCALDAVEDLSTCETILQVFESVGAKPHLCDLTQLNHDVLHMDRPFEIDGVHERPTGIFILLPWGDMLESGFDILVHWKSWHHNVKFLEPAWRWFMSNKGFMAWITHLLETDDVFSQKWKQVPHIPTYLEQGDLVEFVKKPKLGRLGQNISVVRDGVESCTDGEYGDEVCVYQPLVPTMKVEDGRSLMATAWIADGAASTIAFRIFGGDITNFCDEQWIPHRVVFD